MGPKVPIQHTKHLLKSSSESTAKLRGIEVVRWILYADDVVLFARSSQEAEQLLSIINTTCKRFGLNISFKKTKTQVFNDNLMAAEPSLITVDGHEVENVRQFEYLGHIFDNCSVTSATEHQKTRASAKFNHLQTVLCDIKINRRTRWKLLEACVIPRLLYGLQACYPKEDQLKKLEACWFQFLRSMVKGGWKRMSDDPDNPDFRFVYSNADLEFILRAKPLRGILKSHHLRYMGHVCREENVSLTKKMMFADPLRYYRDPWKKIAEEEGLDRDQLLRMTQNRMTFKEFTSKLMAPLRRR